MKVIMFHSIGNHKSDWSRKYLSVPVEQFEGFFRFLVKNRYRTHFLEDWYHAQSSTKVSIKDIVLTFDDGYLDNWVYLYPLLQKYGLKATIFINPGFVDPGEILRPNIKDVWKAHIEASELRSLGFLNWAEIKTMQDSGHVDIQSHSMSHDWLFSSDQLIDLYTGQDDLDWISWIISPQTKYRYISEPANALLTPFGYPVFEYDRALGVRQFKPSADFLDYSLGLAKQYGSSNLVSENKKEILLKLIKYGQKNGYGSYESEQEQLDRYRFELQESKKILEEILGKAVDYLCWPGGGYNDSSVKISEDVGYKASTMASRERYRVRYDQSTYKRIMRMTLATSVNTGSNRYYLDHVNVMALSYLSKSGSNIARNKLRAVKLFYVLKDLMGL